MTTAHRPTWYPAIGGENQGGNKQYMPSAARSAKDIAGFTQMKYRNDVSTDEENMKAELEAKERKHLNKRPREESAAIEDDTEERASKKLKLDAESTEDKEENEPAKLKVKQNKKASNPDADDSDDSDDDSDEEEKDSNDSDSDDSDDDDDDDEAELLRELERIRKEREEDQRRKEAEREREEQDTINREAMAANPLLGAPTSFNIKKKWFEDTVFKNQAKKEVKHKKRFINDTLRNDFHRKFLDKYIK
jgi:protein CWC15